MPVCTLSPRTQRHTLRLDPLRREPTLWRWLLPPTLLCGAENVGQVRKLSPHCCRHTYVTMLQANGVPMETIAALTGHSDIKTTEGYLHQSADTLAKAVEVLNGKATS